MTEIPDSVVEKAWLPLNRRTCLLYDSPTCKGADAIDCECVVRIRAALTAARAEEERLGMVMVPLEPDETVIEAMYTAFRNARRGGVGGMTIDAQYKRERAPELAAYRAMIEARSK